MDATRPSVPDPAAFRTTHWSLIARANADVPAARAALSELCAAYWYPLYAFVRRRGFDAHEAQDLTQDFFARLLEKRDLAAVDRERGRFRSFLLAALSHFLANHWDRARTRKRGGGWTRIPIEAAAAEQRYADEFAVQDSAERLYRRRWALELVERALARLRAESTAARRAAVLTRLEPLLTRPAAEREELELARELGLTENAVRVALHRLRKRLGELLRDEVLRTVADPGELEAELGELIEALGS